jgi:hypothetical protein
MRIAIIDNITNLVENVILSNNLPSLTGKTSVASDIASIGDTYDGESFIPPFEPPYIPTWDDVRALQKQMIDTTDCMWRVARYQMQKFASHPTSDTEAQYLLMDQYIEDIRGNDEGFPHATPELAIAALNNLTDPA